MLCYRCRVDTSSIPEAGKGLFAAEPIKKGSIIEASINPAQIYSRSDLMNLPPESPEFLSSVRLFEDCYISDPSMPDSHFMNHSFKPNCLWHLGFIFALEDIPEDTELTVDYRLLMADDPALAFTDTTTGKLIYGFSWEEKMAYTSAKLAALFKNLTAKELADKVRSTAAA